MAGTEHPQLYLGYPTGAGEPKRVLRGFEEVVLNAGESQSVAMNLTIRDLRSVPIMKTYLQCLLMSFFYSVWDTPSQSYIRPPGTFAVWIGASIKDIRLTGSI